MVKNSWMVMVLVLGLTFNSPHARAAEFSAPQTESIRIMAQQSLLLIDTLVTENHRDATNHYQQLKTELNSLHALLAQHDLNERHMRELFTAYSWMRLIEIDMRQHAWIGAAIAANQMNGEIIRFTDFTSTLDRDLAWMGYLNRDIMLLTMESSTDNLQAIDLRKKELDETWKRVREQLIKDFRNKGLLLRGDDLISRIVRERDTAALIQLSHEGYTFSDEIRIRQ